MSAPAAVDRAALLGLARRARVTVPGRCPRCLAPAPGWRWVREGGVRVLTHDGDVICPADPTFGPLTGPEPLPAPVPLAVAA
ncbi:hypothetical protein [Streptomyces sp. NPDC001380]|uniref:hypothetical protein n=1 Tax=Streptomyces sp. NPDC001380 TaxID=3364566 RepID=UPI0036800040